MCALAVLAGRDGEQAEQVTAAGERAPGVAVDRVAARRADALIVDGDLEFRRPDGAPIP